MAVTLDDMQRALHGEPKADEAIFWYAYAWHSGKGSDLYRAMCEISFTPSEKRKFVRDPDIQRLFVRLEQVCPPVGEYEYRPVRYDDVEPGDILIAGRRFPCLLNRWPCRVFEHENFKCVACKDGPHRLRFDDNGFVIGFRR